MGFREEAPPALSDATRPPAVFFPFVAGSRTTSGSAATTTSVARLADPLTAFTFTAAHDAFGQPCTVTEVAPPRRAGRRDLAGGDEADVLA